MPKLDIKQVRPGAASTVFLTDITGKAVSSEITPAMMAGVTPTAGHVLFQASTVLFGGDNNFFWDNTNKRLGIGTSAPTHRLGVVDTTSR